MPTTANYILVATLMAPVVVELGAQSGLVIPLIAVHLFVFYYGIMGDITPPVGLATFAAAAISGEDPIETGIQGSLYAMRTVILPFILIFNPQLLLIDVARLVASSCWSSSRRRSRCWCSRRRRWAGSACAAAGGRIACCSLAVCLLFRPDFFMDLLAPEYVAAAAARDLRRRARHCRPAAASSW